ncbi:hypothetical protein H0H92_015003 [Tricholoma furcatifolium]|nr:hypothetical protein H0H92_015003 [Tricholoma furcatifolium]
MSKLEFNLTIEIGTGQYTLCIQKALAANKATADANIVSGTVAYNGDNYIDVSTVVLTACKEYSFNNQFGWNTSYSVAATHQVYVEGGTIDGSATTEILPISTTNQDAFILSSWAKWSIEPGSAVAPTNGFAFLPSKDVPLPGATLVAYLDGMSVQGGAPTQAPYWMSPLEYLPGSENSLVPIEQMTVFFTQTQVTPGSMISEGRAYSVNIDFTNQKNHTYRLNNDTTWTQVV